MNFIVFPNLLISFFQDGARVVHYLEKFSNLVLLLIKKTSSPRQRLLPNTVFSKPTTFQQHFFLNTKRKEPWKLNLQDIVTYPAVLPELDALPITNFSRKAIFEITTPYLQLPNLLQIFPLKGSIVSWHVLFQLSPASIFRL